MESIFEAVLELEKKGEPGVLCTVIRSEGSTPRNVGSKMLVYPDGRIEGTVGGGEMESRVIAEALDAYADGKARIVTYRMVDPEQGDPGVCGGQMEVFVEPVMPAPQIVIIGGGHVGKAVVHLAKWLGFRVIVTDDRPEFAAPESTPGADAYYSIPMSQLPEHLEITPWTYLILTTRGVDIDVPGLPALINSNAGYIGVIGSKRRWTMSKKKLHEEGIQEDKLEQVYSPIGLEINAETPEEIAVSILAEIIMLRRGGDGQPMSSPR
jgi:xanthine dehydrogenase accessory factor